MPGSGNVVALTIRKLVTRFAVAESTVLLGNLAIRMSLRHAPFPNWGLALMAILSVIPLSVFAFGFFRIVRMQLDEMLQRVVLEALGFALVVFMPLAGLYVNLRAAGVLRGSIDAPELLLLPSILAISGLAVSWSRLK